MTIAYIDILKIVHHNVIVEKTHRRTHARTHTHIHTHKHTHAHARTPTHTVQNNMYHTDKEDGYVNIINSD
jgi:hypothetical protein